MPAPLLTGGNHHHHHAVINGEHDFGGHGTAAWNRVYTWLNNESHPDLLLLQEAAHARNDGRRGFYAAKRPAPRGRPVRPGRGSRCGQPGSPGGGPYDLDASPRGGQALGELGDLDGDQAAYHFHVSHVLAELDDLAGSIKALQQSNRCRPANERQGRVHANGLLATRQWQYGHVEASADTWSRFLDDYEALSTARGDEHFDTLRQHLAAKPDVRVVRQLFPRAREIAKAKAA
ncbi:hypothetical protein [Kitasatospora indigofera]|uniref:hypothetical protein n=1 Tax=Kitasatospora indigofera TaxID=67307 RepID=UPI0033B38FD0